MGTLSIHPSPSGSDCDDNSVIPVSLDAAVDMTLLTLDPQFVARKNFYREKP